MTHDEINAIESLTVRSSRSITVDVKCAGKRKKMTIKGDHSSAHVMEAIRVREALRDAMSQGMTSLSDKDTLPLAQAYKQMFASARKRREYTLSKDDEAALIIRCNGRCELTGIAFDTSRETWNRRPYSPSLDRVDSSQGYTLDNCRIVCVAINIALNEWGEDVYRYVAGKYLARSAPRLPIEDALATRQ